MIVLISHDVSNSIDLPAMIDDRRSRDAISAAIVLLQARTILRRGEGTVNETAFQMFDGIENATTAPN
ncbi:MAG: hypothetical protein HZA66_24870 [Rhodopseudomonas palustris]|uniref:Uncharacterized protein n=1 Tax=Rhodopseudomonas palustris TaxID=1076 RepID=A0A933S1H7_RHOPL|nr:hypothetical protein [Rhodopseudomonas palustris]